MFKCKPVAANNGPNAPGTAGTTTGTAAAAAQGMGTKQPDGSGCTKHAECQSDFCDDVSPTGAKVCTAIYGPTMAEVVCPASSGGCGPTAAPCYDFGSDSCVARVSGGGGGCPSGTLPCTRYETVQCFQAVGEPCGNSLCCEAQGTCDRGYCAPPAAAGSAGGGDGQPQQQLCGTVSGCGPTRLGRQNRH